MKNLMIYINPRKKFFDEKRYLVKIQIDNSLDLGWKPEDIVLVTNFPYEYKGVTALVAPDDLYVEHWEKSSKVSAIIWLIKKGYVKQGELWWFHDFDAFEAYKITEEELELGYAVAGFTDYGYMRKWNTGSIFFKKDALKIFEWMRNALYRLQCDEERSLKYLTDKNYQYINNFYKRMNITYNFPGCLNGERKMSMTYPLANKPVKVLHFHPTYTYWYTVKLNFLKVMLGHNRLNINFIPDRLFKIFKTHIPELCPPYEDD